MNNLENRLEEVARAPILLIACDYDGTLAPLVDHPEQAEADRAAVVALRSLTRLAQTHVAVISGRALADLAPRLAEINGIHLVGSHGSEFEPGFAKVIPPEATQLHRRLRSSLADIVSVSRECWLEEKPASFAVHYRRATESEAKEVIEKVLREPATWPGVFVRHGKMVLELSVIETNKGRALAQLRQRFGASAVIFLGDDITDEDAFRTLLGPDLGIKIGPGDSTAEFRMPGPVDVSRVLANVSEKRSVWLSGSHATPIERHSLISDQRTCGLIDPMGRLVWMCLPRFDSPAAFSEILGGPTAGYFQVCPVDVRAAEQSYVGDTFILQSRWGGITLTDYLDCGGGRAFQRAGRTDFLRVIEGRGRVRIAFSPRFDFGRSETKLRASDMGVEVEGSIDPLVLRAPGLTWRLESEGHHHTAIAEVELTGDPLVLEMRYGTASLAPDAVAEPVRRERVARFWSGWATALQTPKIAKEAVIRSALILKGLTYGPSGAIVAAATTSLPETIGGIRNWDYRFCWPRDAALAATSLIQLGITGPALRLLDWILGIVDQSQPGAFLCPVYTVTGAHLMPESEIAELGGYRGSRPVRIGNAASQQIQLDIFGPIADLIDQLARQGAALSAEHWRLLETMVEAVANRWREPDHGIWEVRRPRRHHVHSKVMCWQTVDRALRVAKYIGRSRSGWGELRDTIQNDIISNGLRDSRIGFQATYEDAEADASVLLLGLSGIIDSTDARYLATLQEIDRRLRVGPTVYRYRYDDGLPGQEGGFHICALWLARALVAAGRRDEAAELFEGVLSLAGPTGLLSEEYEPYQKVALGNVPQAYSHLALIDVAVALSTG